MFWRTSVHHAYRMFRPQMYCSQFHFLWLVLFWDIIQRLLSLGTLSPCSCVSLLPSGCEVVRPSTCSLQILKYKSHILSFWPPHKVPGKHYILYLQASQVQSFTTGLVQLLWSSPLSTPQYEDVLNNTEKKKKIWFGMKGFLLSVVE